MEVWGVTKIYILQNTFIKGVDVNQWDSFLSVRYNNSAHWVYPLRILITSYE